MARFKFFAMDAKGKETEGVLDAENQTAAVSMIRSKGLFPTRVMEVGGVKKKADADGAAAQRGMHMELKLPKFFAGRVNAKQLTVFTRQLATLVEAGLPLLRGLRILLKQEKHPGLREAISGMGEAVEGGSTFSEALSQYPKVFDKLFVNMVRAGEAGGVLDTVLKRLAEFQEKAERIKNKVKSAMVYPTVVLVAAIGILTFLLTSVIPRFKQIFEDLLEGKELPALTQFVINLSNLIKERGVIVLGVVVALVFGWKTLGKTERGRYVIDSIKLKAPVFGSLNTRTAVARFARTLGTLLSSGVPILQALMIVKETAGNEVISKAIQQVHDSVKEGEPMAGVLESAGVFPGMVISMVDVGEETGALPDMLMKVADTYDDEVDRAVEGLTSIIEPIMIVMLAVIVGTIVIAMFVPLISIVGQMSV